MVPYLGTIPPSRCFPQEPTWYRSVFMLFSSIAVETHPLQCFMHLLKGRYDAHVLHKADIRI